MSSGRRTLLMTLAASVLLLGAIPFAHYLIRAPREQDGPADDPAVRSDLVLSEAYLAGEGAARRVEGFLRNVSSTHYRDVRVEFFVRGQTNALLGRVTARVDTAPPDASLPFATEPVPEGAVRIALSSISGIPH
jgi:hypothetical protein